MKTFKKLRPVLLSIVALFGLLAKGDALAACAPAPAGLVAWWQAEENANDMVGSNQGTPQGGVVYNTGEAGQAFVFNGSNAWIDVPSSPDLKVTGPFTVEAWVNYDRFGNANGNTIVAKGIDSYTAIDWELEIKTTGKLRPHVYVGGGWQYFDCATALQPGVWYHVAMVYDGAAIRGYVNGVLDGSMAASGAVRATDYSLKIGAYAPVNGGTGARNLFAGRIDELSLYNRALTINEIQAIHAAGSGGKCLPTPTPPVILTQPTNQTLVVGNIATLTVVAGGTTPLGYQWQSSGVDLADATNAQFVLNYVQLADAGNYQVIVTNALGAATSSIAVLTVNPAPPCGATAPAGLINWWWGGGDATDIVGGKNGILYGGATFTTGQAGQGFNFDGIDDWVYLGPDVGNFGTNDFTVEFWMKTTSTRWEAVMGKRNACRDYGGWDIRLGAVAPEGFLDFELNFGNENNVFLATTNAVNDGNWHHIALVRQQTNVTFYVDGSFNAATNRPGVCDINNEAPFTAGTETTCIGVDGTSRFTGQLDEVSFYGRALDATEIQEIFNADSAGKCLPQTAPIIITQPAAGAVTEEDSVTFTVGAAGMPPLSFQWQLNGGDIAGATSSRLVLPNASLSAAGDYRVVVSNSFGGTPSSNATLTVNLLGSCVPQPSGLAHWWRGEGDVTDQVGGANGSLLNGASASAAGKVGQGFMLDGVDDVVDFGPDAGNFGTNDFTVEFWIKTRSPYPGAVLGKRASCDWAGGWDIRSGNGSGTLGMEFNPGIPGSVTWLLTPPVNDGNWHHIVYVRQQTQLKVFVDGACTGTASAAVVAPFNNAAHLTIGGNACIGVDGTSRFIGQIDEISLYQRALCAYEIQQLHEARSNGKCPDQIAPPSASCGAPATLTIITNGYGRVIQPPGLPNVSLGNTYILIAVPEPHNLFSNWLCVANGTTNEITTPSARITISGDTTMIVNFVTNRLGKAKGAYYGLFSDQEQGVSRRSAGYFTFRVTERGTLSGKLLLDGGKTGFTGKLDPLHGHGSTMVYRGDKPALALSLQLALDDTDQVTGQVDNATDAWTAGLLGDRANNGGGAPSRYTMLLPGQADSVMPAGDGYSTASVTARGAVRMAGRLGDGQTFSPVTATISRDGFFPMYASPSNQAVMGWVHFTNAPQPTLTGDLVWMRSGSVNGVCETSFTNGIELVASGYTPPAYQQRGIFITNGTIVLNEGNLPDPITNQLTISDANKITLVTTNGSMKSMTFIPTTGLLKANFVHPDKPGVTTPVSGVYLQNQNHGGGFFVGTNQTGPLRLKNE